MVSRAVLLLTLPVGLFGLTGCGGDEEAKPLTARRKIEVPLAKKVRASVDDLGKASSSSSAAGLSVMPSAPKPEPIPETVTPKQAPAKTPERLAPVQKLRRGHGLKIGRARLVFLETRILVDERGVEHESARFSVAFQRKSYLVDAWEGKSVRIGGSRLEVVSVAGDVARYRWYAAKGELVKRISDQDGLVRLPEMGFYRLPDNTLVAVGNVATVRRGAGSGVANRPRVTIGIYPADYERDPLNGYDLFAHASQASRLRGYVRRATLRRVVPADADGPGYVELVFLDS